MGFGTLLFGYFLSFAIPISFAGAAGALVMMWAFTKLAEFNRWFNYALIPTIVFLLACGAAASNSVIPWYTADGTAAFVVSLVKEIAAGFTHIFVFLGTGGICGGSGAEGLVRKTKRSFVSTMVYYAVRLPVVVFGVYLPGEWAGYLITALLLYWYVCVFMNLALIYQCFGIIIPAEGEIEKKRSRIPLFRFLDEKFDELDEKRNAYRRESMQMAWDEAGRRAAEREKKKKNKKKKK